MLGPSRAGRRRRRFSSRNLGQLAAVLGVGFALVAGASNCGFPAYDFVQLGGAGGVAGSASGESGSAGIPASTGGAGGVGSGGEGGEGGVGDAAQSGAAGAAGAAGAVCVFPAPISYPAHCFNTNADSGETGLNCGGGECAPCSSTDTCSQNSDCLSNVCTSAKACAPLLTLSYTSTVVNAFTRTLKFYLSIKYLDANSTPLSTLRIRYYFNHNQVAEPLLAHTQATYDPGGAQRNLSDSELSYQIVRYPPGPDSGPASNRIATDSFLELTFPSGVSVTKDAIITVTQDIVAGNSPDASAQFQQSTHYSFINTNSAPLENEAITVYRGDQLLWGVPPPMNVLPDCAFVAGVNLNGPALTSGGQALEASDEAGVDYSGATYQSTAALVPSADSGTTALLHTGYTLGSAVATWPVPNGKYWAYAWLTSAVSTDSGQLSIQDSPADKFFGVQQAAGTVWARIGPYAIDVLGGSVKLSGTGTVNVAGVELFQVAP